MIPAVLCALLAVLFLALTVYSLDLMFFLIREKKHFEENFSREEYLFTLHEKQKKAKHFQKKNYYLYLICLALFTSEQKEKANRLLPFLKNDPMLGVFKSDFS